MLIIRLWRRVLLWRLKNANEGCQSGVFLFYFYISFTQLCCICSAVEMLVIFMHFMIRLIILRLKAGCLFVQKPMLPHWFASPNAFRLCARVELQSKENNHQVTIFNLLTLTVFYNWNHVCFIPCCLLFSAVSVGVIACMLSFFLRIRSDSVELIVSSQGQHTD